MKTKFKKEDISEISQKLLEKILKKKNKTAKVLALSGNLGTGKTTLTQELAQQLGIRENIISPTFVIMKIYEINQKSKYYINFKKLIHIDAYRLEDENEILKIGWDEFRDDEDNLIIIEWPEKIGRHLKKEDFLVKLEHIDDQTRTVEF